MGVVTATFQYANASPVANGSYQWKLSSDAIQFSSASNCTVPTIIGGNLDANGNMTSTFAFNDVLSTTAGAVTTYQLTVKAANGGQVWNENYYLTGSAANLNLIPPSQGSPFITVTTNVTTLPSGVTGDIIRFNVNNDNQWDAVNHAQAFSFIIPIWGGTPSSPAQIGGPLSTGYGTVSGSNHTSVDPNFTTGVGDKWSSANALASTSVAIGQQMGTNGNNSVMGIWNFYRWSQKFAAVTSSSYRYWMGLGAYTNSGTPNNNQNILSTGRYAADSPNATTIGFRFSSGTDTHWQAISAIAGGSQTAVDTGIAIDNNPHLFEFNMNFSVSAITFFIDSVPVATVTSPIPQVFTSGSANSWMTYFWTGDNKNSAVSVAATMYGWTMSHRI